MTRAATPCPPPTTVSVVYSGLPHVELEVRASRAPRSTNIIEYNFFFSERNAFIARLAVWDDSVVTGTIFSLKKTPRYTEENNSRTVLILTL